MVNLQEVEFTKDDLKIFKFLVLRELNDTRNEMLLSPCLNQRFTKINNKYAEYLSNLVNKLSFEIENS